MTIQSVEETDPSSTEHCISSLTLRFIAGVLTAATFATFAVDLFAGPYLPATLRGALVGVTIVAWSVYRSTRAEERVCGRVDRVANLIANARASGYAAGYVDGIRRKLPDEQTIQSLG